MPNESGFENFPKNGPSLVKNLPTRANNPVFNEERLRRPRKANQPNLISCNCLCPEQVKEGEVMLKKAAIGLGVLFVVGGLVFGVSNMISMLKVGGNRVS